LTTLHEKAIYLHEGSLFHVEKFDYAERKAYVKSVECDYYTDAIDYTQVKILESFDDRTLGSLIANHGEVRLNRQIIGFKKLKFYTNENVGAGDLQMPEQEMHTTSFWLRFPSAYLQSFEDASPTERQNGVAGLANVLRTVAALLLMCDPRGLGVAVSGDAPDERGLFEAGPVPLRQLPRRHRPERTAACERCCSAAAGLIEACLRSPGCPGCVGPPGEAGGRAKVMALRLATGTAELARTAEGSLAAARETT
jgi:DEAD/DEAH box helicase domain-containing protein